MLLQRKAQAQRSQPPPLTPLPPLLQALQALLHFTMTLFYAFQQNYQAKHTPFSSKHIRIWACKRDGSRDSQLDFQRHGTNSHTLCHSVPLGWLFNNTCASRLRRFN